MFLIRLGTEGRASLPGRSFVKAIIRFVALLGAAGVLFACAQPTPSLQATSAPAPTTPPAPTSSPVPTSTPVPTHTPQATAPYQAATPAVSAERIAAGQVFAEQFLNRDYAAVVAQFDATMKSVFPIDKVKEARESLEPQLGAFKRTVGLRAEKYKEYDIVYVTWEFEQATIDLKIVFDQAGQITGLWFQPSQATTPAPYAPPAYANSSAFREQEVTVGSGEWALPGTLTLPVGDGPFPAVVLVHGSGPNDRDETIGPNKPFRDLAWGLASRGIAVLRYEKRTKQHTAKFTDEVLAKLTVKEETVDDALAAAALLRQTKEIDPARIYVLGHSLGGYLLPRIGTADPQIAGLIVMAGPVRPLEDLMLEQYTYIFGLDGISAEEQAQLDELAAQVARAQDPNLTLAAATGTLPLGTAAAFWLDLRGYNPAEVAKGLVQPMLILQGGRDYQVSVVDFEGWQSALASRSPESAQLKLYPNLNHLFMAGEGKSTPAEYEIAGHVAEQVIEDIAGWILSR